MAGFGLSSLLLGLEGDEVAAMEGVVFSVRGWLLLWRSAWMLFDED